jgi:hypothetical protein
MVGAAGRQFCRARSRPRWTPAVSRDKLEEILSVPVEMRTASNALPAHAEVSLQAVIRNFDSGADKRRFSKPNCATSDWRNFAWRPAWPF